MKTLYASGSYHCSSSRAIRSSLFRSRSAAEAAESRLMIEGSRWSRRPISFPLPMPHARARYTQAARALTHLRCCPADVPTMSDSPSSGLSGRVSRGTFSRAPGCFDVSEILETWKCPLQRDTITSTFTAFLSFIPSSLSFLSLLPAAYCLFPYSKRFERNEAVERTDWAPVPF